MSDETLRLWSYLGLASLWLALAGSVASASLERPRAQYAAAACGLLVQLGLYLLLIAAWRGTGSPGWPVPTAGFLLCALPAHVAAVAAAARYGGRVVPVATALFILVCLGVVWATRIGGRDPVLLAGAITVGIAACAALAWVEAHVRGPRLGRLLTSPWLWGALCLALLGLTWLQRDPSQGGPVVGIAWRGAFVQPTELAFKLVFPVFLAAAIVPYVRFAARDPEPPLLLRWLALGALMLAVCVVFAAPLVLLLGEHGTLALGALLLFAMLFVAGRGRDLVVPMLASALLAPVVAWQVPRVGQRLEATLSAPCAEGREGDHRCRAATTAASSEVIGVGIAAGRARWVFEADSDFPVSGFIEELGLPGIALVWIALGVLATFVLRGLGPLPGARAPPELSVRAAACHGLLLAIVIQASWNHGMNLGLLPIMGVPFPWLSFSGTTALASTVAAGTAAILAFRSAQ